MALFFIRFRFFSDPIAWLLFFRSSGEKQEPRLAA